MLASDDGDIEAINGDLKIIEPPETKRKKALALVIVGIILIIAGTPLIYMGYLPINQATEANEVFKKYDNTTLTYLDYSTNETILISGELVNKFKAEEFYKGFFIEFPETGSKYKYILDDGLEFYTNDNVGEVGDTLIVECEVIDAESGAQFLRAKEFYNPYLLIIPSIIMIIGGLVIIIIYYRRWKVLSSKTTHTAFKVASLYRLLKSSDDDESAMYEILKTKQNDQTTLTETKESTEPIESTKSIELTKSADSLEEPNMKSSTEGTEQAYMAVLTKPATKDQDHAIKPAPMAIPIDFDTMDEKIGITLKDNDNRAGEPLEGSKDEGETKN